MTISWDSLTEDILTCMQWITYGSTLLASTNEKVLERVPSKLAGKPQYSPELRECAAGFTRSAPCGSKHGKENATCS